MFRSALLILSGNAAASLLLLARNLIVARLIPVADYGIAATFAIAMAVVEMMSHLGLQQQIIQAKNGEDPRFQAALQGFQLLRGMIAGGVLFLLARPLSDFLNVSQAAWAYQVMALVPVLNALVHFDVYRMNRSMVFWPVILTGAVPALMSVLAVWPLALFYNDYKIMLLAILVQAAMTTLTSHIVAHRPYRITLDRIVMLGSLRFGWPLLINGILMFAVFNGDKVIVGRELGMETLAIFAMGFTLTLTPTLVMAKSAQSFFLPQLSSIDRTTKEGAKRFQLLSAAVIQAILVGGASFAVLIAIFGASLVSLLLGARYAELGTYFVLLAIMQAIRLAKAGPSIIALAVGHTSNAMVSNSLRVLSLPLAWYIAITTESLKAIIFIAIIAEVLGLGVSLLLLRRRSSISLKGVRWPICAASFLAVVIIYMPLDNFAVRETLVRIVFDPLVYVGLGSVMFLSCDELRYYLKHQNTYSIKPEKSESD